jgi:hypothetical protein
MFNESSTTLTKEKMALGHVCIGDVVSSNQDFLDPHADTDKIVSTQI